MSESRGRTTWLGGVLFGVLALTGNLMQGATPALHGDPSRAADFYSGAPVRLALATSVSLISLVFLAWFLSVLRSVLLAREGSTGNLGAAVFGGGMAALGLLAAGFAFSGAGALRALNNSVSPDIAVVFYDGGGVLAGLAAPVAMAVMLAATAMAIRRLELLPSWFGWVTAVLAVVGVIGPLAWSLLLLFPLWVILAAILLARQASLREGSPQPT